MEMVSPDRGDVQGVTVTLHLCPVAPCRDQCSRRLSLEQWVEEGRRSKRIVEH